MHSEPRRGLLFGTDPPPSSLPSSSSPRSAPPISEWFGEIDVGTPANGFSVVLDTGSADLILAEPGCTGCQANTPGYNPGSSSTSSTSRQDFTIQYGSGSASGSLVEDRISIANYTQPNQIFAACSTMNNIVDGTISGILGLGWQNIAASQAMPLVQSLYENNTLPEPVFAFAFECVPPTLWLASIRPGSADLAHPTGLTRSTPTRRLLPLAVRSPSEVSTRASTPAASTGSRSFSRPDTGPSRCRTSTSAASRSASPTSRSSSTPARL